MNIILVRHSNAEDESELIKDFDRKLNEKGIEKAKMISKLCSTEALNSYCFNDNTLFISSPVTRALETAKIFANTLDFKNTIVEKEFLYHSFEPDFFLNDISNLKEKNIWVFGHNPTILNLLRYLSGKSIWTFPKCMVTALSVDKFEERGAETIYSINPKKL